MSIKYYGKHNYFNTNLPAGICPIRNPVVKEFVFITLILKLSPIYGPMVPKPTIKQYY
jgi:hypothetical protein